MEIEYFSDLLNTNHPTRSIHKTEQSKTNIQELPPTLEEVVVIEIPSLIGTMKHKFTTKRKWAAESDDSDDDIVSSDDEKNSRFKKPCSD
ncbi:hypothetical protein TNIN_445081 [Trichonephila inaurata madagascariensis]|uniref:Uncharacterized protein n=1 Tax=Trichonephila inaurata madagascariensis TaxID=2747483 RepID=A0A8X6XW26_9ARAC|nr:hypothetical protein TNIN_445081 [Trichonephila inaurata madagascariensis]